MSRSYKKHPVCTDNRHSGSTKRIVNRSIRAHQRAHPEDIANGGHYRRFWCSWDICEYRFRTSWAEWLQMARKKLGRELTPEDVRDERRDWVRYYRTK
jgi:hypothetical protein